MYFISFLKCDQEVVNEIEMKKKGRVSTMNFKKSINTRQNAISDKSDFFYFWSEHGKLDPAGFRVKIFNEKFQKVMKYQKYIHTYIFHERKMIENVL